MDKISCDITLMIDGIKKSPEEILNQIKDIEKYEIHYGQSLNYSEKKEGKK